MNFLNALLEEEKITKQAEGESYAIQWMPDVYTRETLNIGICFNNKVTGEFSHKLLDYFDRIHCLFGKDAEFNLKLACDVANDLLRNGQLEDMEFLTEQIRCVRMGYAQGNSTDEILKRLYFDLVPLGRKPKKPATKKFSPTSRETLYKNLVPFLKESLSIEYSLYVPENPYESIQLPTGKREVYIPFKKSSGIATLISTSYSDIQRVKCNLFEGYQDIDIASSRLSRNNNAVFVLMPTSDSQLDNTVLHEVENQIDNFVWQLQRHKIQVEPHTEHVELARYIAEWCVKAA